MSGDILLKLAEGLFDVLRAAVDIPGEDLLSFRVFILGLASEVLRNVAEAFELILGKALLDEVQRLRLGTPVEGLGELILRFSCPCF